MVSQEIITALKNAIDHGDSLENATQVMINSGYNPSEVHEASRFFGGSAVKMQQPKPEENLAMPAKKGLFRKFSKKQKPQPANIIPPNPPAQIPTPTTIYQKQLAQTPPKSQFKPTLKTQQPASANQIQRLVQPTNAPKQPQPTPQPPTISTQTQPVQNQPISGGEPTSAINPYEFPKPIGGEKGDLTKDIEKIKPTGENHSKEIILLIILLVLIIILVLSFVFKDKIIGLFSFFLGLL